MQLTDFGACRALTVRARRQLRESELLLQTIRNGDWKEEDPSEASSSSGAAAFSCISGSARDGESETAEGLADRWGVVFKSLFVLRCVRIISQASEAFDAVTLSLVTRAAISRS